MHMTIKGKRIFNYRPVCFAALAMILGIILGEAIRGERLSLVAVPISVFVAATVVLAVFKKSRRFAYLPVFALIGSVGMIICSAVYANSVIEPYNGAMTARVTSEIVRVSGNSYKFFVDGVSIDGETLLPNSALVYVQNEKDEPDFNAGDIVFLVGDIEQVDAPKFGSQIAYAFSNGNTYNITCYYITKSAECDPDFILGLQTRIKKLLYQNLDQRGAQIAQALLIGDKFGMDSEFRNNVSVTGLAHILAISGLHISALSGALYFVLKKLKVKPLPSFIVVTAVLLVYATLCNFTASVLRALIMSTVFYLSTLLGKKHDSLSALALSAIVILLFRPTDLFSIGFLESFSSVLGIVMFAKPFEEAGQRVVNKLSPKRHFGKRIASTLALTFSANILLYPIIVYFFGDFPLFFILSSLIMVPYMTAAYVLLLALTVIALVTTWGGALWIMKFLFIPFRVYVYVFGGLPFSLVPATIFGVAGVVTYALIGVTSSRYVFGTQAAKVKTCMSMAAVGLLVCTLVALV